MSILSKLTSAIAAADIQTPLSITIPGNIIVGEAMEHFANGNKPHSELGRLPTK